ncbi:MAG: response regulator [Ilumatobacteraceae bacterium]
MYSYRETPAGGRRSLGPHVARACLRARGYEVDAVTNGAEALDRFVETCPDLVVLDVSMPHVDGLTVCRVLRAEGHRVPVLMLTAAPRRAIEWPASTPARTTIWRSRSTSTELFAPAPVAASERLRGSARSSRHR